MGAFFMFFCDNHLDVINTLSIDLRKRIEQLEQQRAIIKTQEDLDNVRATLTSIINDICAAKNAKNAKLLKFIGGLTMIERSMTWEDGKPRYTDINDNSVLI